MRDELRDDWIAAEMAFGSGEQFIGRKFSGDEAEIQVALANRFHFLTADVTQISLITTCHDYVPKIFARSCVNNCTA